jgi:hypothetical protein
MDTATSTKQNVNDRELDPTKPQSTGNDKFKTQLSTETFDSVSAIWYWFDQVFVLIVNTDCYTTMPSVTHYWVLNYAVIKTLG